jgi:hypothetical protein
MRVCVAGWKVACRKNPPISPLPPQMCYPPTHILSTTPNCIRPPPNTCNYQPTRTNTLHPLKSFSLQNPPQQNKAPLVFTPHVWMLPTLTADQVPPPDTATGTALVLLLPSPSCPSELPPAKGCTGGDEPRPGRTVALTPSACGEGGRGRGLRHVYVVQCRRDAAPNPQLTPAEQGAAGFQATCVDAVADGRPGAAPRHRHGHCAVRGAPVTQLSSCAPPWMAHGTHIVCVCGWDKGQSALTCGRGRV